MPFIHESSYRPPKWLSNGHLQTIYGGLLRSVEPVAFKRERIETADNDFLDLDWSIVNPESKSIVIVSHGIAGSSRQNYVVGMVRAFNRHGFNAIAWNYRGCSGEANRKVVSYHMGWTYDLEQVVNHAIEKEGFEQVFLVGFSAGGNITLKYLGEKGDGLPRAVKAGVAFSVPCEVPSCAVKLDSRYSWLYSRSMMRVIKRRLLEKAEHIQGVIDMERLKNAQTWKEFDEIHTAPVYGFSSAEDYWQKSSSGPYLDRLTVPTLLINAKDDPLLAQGCYPNEVAASSSVFHLETPDNGGHVGFVAFNDLNEFWSEKRATEFIMSLGF